jgi:CheY-specific phosphatase CheX
VQAIQEIIRDCAVRRMKSHSGSAEVQTAEISPDYSRKVHGNWMGLILVSGRDLRITFKVHFNLREVRMILGNMLGKSHDQISETLALDFAKEFCNLTAGNLKQVFEEQEDPINTGISLPIVTRGFDDLFYQSASEGETSELWKISVAGVELYCTPHVHVFDQAKLANLKYTQSDDAADEDDGEIDFL